MLVATHAFGAILNSLGVRIGAASRKQEKDLLQAAVLAAILAASAAGSLSSAADALPRGSKSKAARGAARAARLVAGSYPAAEDFLDALAGAKGTQGL